MIMALCYLVFENRGGVRLASDHVYKKNPVVLVLDLAWSPLGGL